MKYTFKSTQVSYHFDTPKQLYQVYIKNPYKWICSAPDLKQAQRVADTVDQLLRLPTGAQITHHLNDNVT